MKSFSFLLGVMVLSECMMAQSDSKRVDSLALNTISFNVANAVVIGSFSLNYDRNLFILPKSQVLIKSVVGKGYDYDEAIMLYGIGLGHVLGTGKHHFEYDLGINVMQDLEDPAYNSEYYSSVDTALMINIGYRYQRPQGGLMGRIGIGKTGAYLGLGISF